MSFAVELHIDEANAAPIIALSDTIYAQCGGASLTGMGGHPHLSLTVFAELADPTAVAALLAEFAAETPPIPVTLSAIGVFSGTQGVVYLAPVVTAELLALHARFHERFAQLAIVGNAYYLPGNWIPHCTVGFELPADNMGQAVALCQQADVFRAVTLTTIRLIEFWPVRPIFTYHLQGA